jgi:hypothetical protein
MGFIEIVLKIILLLITLIVLLPLVTYMVSYHWKKGQLDAILKAMTHTTPTTKEQDNA